MQFLTAQSLLKMVIDAFYFMLKAFFSLKIFKFLSHFFAHVGRRLDKEAKVNVKIYDVTTR